MYYMLTLCWLGNNIYVLCCRGASEMSAKLYDGPNGVSTKVLKMMPTRPGYKRMGGINKTTIRIVLGCDASCNSGVADVFWLLYSVCLHDTPQWIESDRRRRIIMHQTILGALTF